jgi:dihydroneopterin aldolase
MEVIIEIEGLELHGYHGVLPREQRDGQLFLFDVTLVAHDAGARTDKLKDTIDYTQVADCIREISDAQRYNLIEALAATIADELLHRFDVSRVRVRVRKPQVELTVPVGFTAATVERTRR